MMWFWMRQAAVFRHVMWNLYVEGGDPAKWRAHSEMIRKFYGW